jgi:hypothetical protein
MDDDNEAKPHELETFMRAATATSADIYTCFSTVFSGSDPSTSTIPTQTAIFVGPDLSAAKFANPVGDANMLVRVSAVRQIDGFSEYYRVGREDQEFFVRAMRAGLQIELVPETLYFYRLNQARIRHGHVNQFAGLSRVQHSMISSLPIQEMQSQMLAQGINYAAGPLGNQSSRPDWKISLYEYSRYFVAKYPRLYSLATMARSYFR